MATIYEDGTYLAENPGWHAEDSAWKAEQVLALLESEGVRPRTVGEVGCGAGEVLRAIHDALPHARCEGWETAAQAPALRAPRTSDRLRFRHGDLTSHPDARYDVLLCLDVFEHVPDYLGFLAGLRPHGELLVFHVPLDMTVWNVLRGQPIRLRQRIGHLHYFDAATALSSLEESGYRIRAHRYTAGSLELPARTALRSLARLPRRALRRLDEDLAARLLGGFSLLVLAE